MTVVVTSYNEQKNAPEWCLSFLKMEALPAELIVADSDSTDDTVAILRAHFLSSPVALKILKGKCSISEGRNKAIAAASHELVAITDFGVTFDPNWLPRMHEALQRSDWVGGCYSLRRGNRIQTAFARLFERKPESIDEKTFLPSSRSFGVRKSLFLEVGGYDTSLVLGEDTALVLKLRSLDRKYELQRKAMVHWAPRSTLKAVYLQSYRYAFWDGVARQNQTRWLHISFLALCLLPLVNIALYPSLVSAGVAALCASAAYTKISRNTMRSTASARASGMEVIVYLTCTAGSSLGFLAGMVSRRHSRNA